MRADPFALEASPLASDAGAVPFASEFVTLTRQEHIELVMQAHYFKTLHERAVARAAWREDRYKRVLRQMKEQGAQREAALRAELEAAHARIRYLQQRLFGSKTERHRGDRLQGQESSGHAPRGQRRGAPGHGRAMQSNLPARYEFVELEAPQCPRCGLKLKLFPGTEDAEILELEVNAYRRVIHRRRYSPVCRCGCLPGIVSAPPPARLINRGKFGISVWTQVLLDKFAYGRPSQRLVQDLADHDLRMSPGTLAGGLQAIAPLFEPIGQALMARLRSEQHLHADETRWAVFVDIEGKVGHRWYLWVFHARSVVHYVLDPARSSQVVTDELAGVKDAILSCDRYSAYKKFARLHPGVVLAFCWAHQRRDFLELAHAYPACEPWAFEWVDAIGQLYHLNAVRLQTPADSDERAAAQADLQEAVQRLADQRERALADPRLAEPARKVLQSMAAHWSGLTVFVDAPWVPMDNNTAERDLRGPVVGRKNFYGSGAQWSGKLAATMYSVLATLGLWQINARTWLGAYLQACADNGNRAPADLDPFLPWAMDEARLAALRATRLGARTEVFDSS
jgi:transposase